MLKQVNLQNASYETQLQLLKDIEKQQRENARPDLENNVEDQGNLLVDAYKKKGEGVIIGANAEETEVAQKLANDGFGEFNQDTSYFKFNIDPDDPKAIAELYDDLTKEIENLSDTYSSENLSMLKKWRTTLKQYVTNYNDAVDQLHDNNLPDIVSENLEKLTNQKNARNNTFTPVEEMSFDDEIKSTKEYTEAYKKLQEAKKAALVSRHVRPVQR